MSYWAQNVPVTHLNLLGEWGSLSTIVLAFCGLTLAHQTYKMSSQVANHKSKRQHTKDTNPARILNTTEYTSMTTSSQTKSEILTSPLKCDMLVRQPMHWKKAAERYFKRNIHNNRVEKSSTCMPDDNISIFHFKLPFISRYSSET